MVSILYIDKLRRNADFVTSSADTPEKNCPHVQPLAHRSYIDILAFEGKSRCPCDYVKLLDLR